MPILTPDCRAEHDTKLCLSPRFLLGLALDRSSSMHHIRHRVVSGYNSLLEHQQQLTGEAQSTLVTFASFADILYTNIPIAELPMLTQEQYLPSGSTALLDGLGACMEEIETQFNLAPEVTQVLVAILSDGAENSSHAYTVEEIAQEITFHREFQGWVFLFLAAGNAAAEYARNKLELPPHCVIDFLAEDVQTLFLKLSKAIEAYRTGDTNYLRLMQ